MQALISYPLAAGLAVLLLVAAWGDIRTRTISNLLNGAIALAAPLWWYAEGLSLWPGVAGQLALAAGVFVIFAALFAAGAMGGGDVKLLTALALWFPAMPLMRLLVVMAIAGGAVTIVMLIVHRVQKAEGRPEIPYGVAISIAGLIGLALDMLPPHA
jgi:prepilin peptidase CpaA